MNFLSLMMHSVEPRMKLDYLHNCFWHRASKVRGTKIDSKKLFRIFHLLTFFISRFSARMSKDIRDWKSVHSRLLLKEKELFCPERRSFTLRSKDTMSNNVRDHENMVKKTARDKISPSGGGQKNCDNTRGTFIRRTLPWLDSSVQ